MLGPKFSKMIILTLTFVSEFSKDKKTQFTFTFYFQENIFILFLDFLKDKEIYFSNSSLEENGRILINNLLAY